MHAWALLAFLLWVLVGMWVTHERAEIWGRESSLWASAVQTHPTVRAWLNYGNSLAREGRWDAAMHAYDRAEALAQVPEHHAIREALAHNRRLVRVQQDGRLSDDTFVEALTGCRLTLMLQGLGC